VFSYNDVLTVFEAKRHFFPEPHKPVTAKKSAFGSGLRKTLPLETTNVRYKECQREITRLNRA